MVRYSRRRLLYLGSTTVVSGLSGCLGSSEDDAESVELGGLRAENFDTEPHTLHLLLTQDGEPTYWQSQRIPAATGDSGGTGSFEGYPKNSSKIHLHVRVDSQEYRPQNSRELSDFDISCLAFEFHIEPAEQSDQVDVSIWASNDPLLCDQSPSPSAQ